MKKETDNNKNLINKYSRSAEEKAKKTINEYKKFAIKGNVVDLAIGIVIGSAFTNIINTLVGSFITPILSIFTSKVDIGSLFISLSGGDYSTIQEAKEAGAIIVSYGELFNALLNFFIVSVVLFIVFKYITKLRASSENIVRQEIKETTKACQYCKSTINIEATRCAFCTSKLDK